MSEEKNSDSKLTLNGIVFFAFLALVVSLGFMQPVPFYSRYRIPYTDLIFLLTFSFWILALILRKTIFQWHQFYWLLLFYLGAMTLSAAFSNNPKASFIKLLGEIYLLTLPVLTFNLVRNSEDSKKVVFAWLVGASIAVFVGLLTVILFYVNPQNPLLNYTLSHYGTVPIGNYPRIVGSFFNANMLCNYLNAGLMFALIAKKLGWLNQMIAHLLIAGILLTALFTISPGLGGIALCLGVWLWLEYKNRNNLIARIFLFGGVSAALFFLILLFIAFQPHPTAPFTIKIPFSEQILYPSSRVLVWTDSIKTFAENPLFGVGLGEDVCRVRYLNPSGRLEDLRDAHNVLLSVAGQTGIFGLFAILGIIFYLIRKILPLNDLNSEANILKAGFGLAFIGAFLYQGLSSSFEDARHLWVIAGLILFAESFSKNEISAQGS